MITGSDRVSLLWGRIRSYQVRLGLTGRIRLRYAVRAHEPLSHGTGRLRRVGRAREGRPKSRIQIRKHFSCSKLFYKLQINLNLNQI
jgi:hypothetical protein